MSRSLTVTCLVKLWLKMLLCPLLFSVVAACRLRVRPAARVCCGGRRAASAALGLPAHKEGKISPRPLRGTGSFPGLIPLALLSLSGSAVRSVLLSIHPQRVVVHHARPRQYGCVRPDGPTHPKPTVPDHGNAFPEEGEGAGGCPRFSAEGGIGVRCSCLQLEKTRRSDFLRWSRGLGPSSGREGEAVWWQGEVSWPGDGVADRGAGPCPAEAAGSPRTASSREAQVATSSPALAQP